SSPGFTDKSVSMAGTSASGDALATSLREDRPVGGIWGFSEAIRGELAEFVLEVRMYGIGVSIATHPTRSGSALCKGTVLVHGFRSGDSLVIQGAPLAE